MVKGTTTPAVPSPDAEIAKLKSAILGIDQFSQAGFSKISSIARLALSALETPARPRQDEDIANALTAIWHIADDVENCINCSAEEMGANYIDDELARRRAATPVSAMVEGAEAQASVRGAARTP